VLRTKQIAELVAEIVEPFLEQHSFELVDVEYVKEGSNWYLRVYVDKENGIDVEDCGLISQFLSAKLDETDPIVNAYFLEVSSPGAERPLKKPEDFLKAIEQHVFIGTYEPIDGLKEFEGTLTSYDEQTLSVKVGKKSHQIPLEKVALARLAIKF
jgi:ribosome maturation factor RimP